MKTKKPQFKNITNSTLSYFYAEDVKEIGLFCHHTKCGPIVLIGKSTNLVVHGGIMQGTNKFYDVGDSLTEVEMQSYVKLSSSRSVELRND